MTKDNLEEQTYVLPPWLRQWEAYRGSQVKIPGQCNANLFVLDILSLAAWGAGFPDASFEVERRTYIRVISGDVTIAKYLPFFVPIIGKLSIADNNSWERVDTAVVENMRKHLDRIVKSAVPPPFDILPSFASLEDAVEQMGYEGQPRAPPQTI